MFYSTTAACYSALDCISTTLRMTRACSVEDFGITSNWLASIFSGWLSLRRYLLGQLWQSQGYRSWSYSLSTGTTWARQVDKIRDQQVLSMTLSPYGYAALRDVNIIQSLWIIILLSDSKSAHHVLLWNQCTFSYNPSKIFARVRFVQTQSPWNLEEFLFEHFSPLKEENINIERVNIFCTHNYSSSYTQLFQISQILKTCLGSFLIPLPCSHLIKILNNTAMIGNLENALLIKFLIMLPYNKQ